jgi:hypothetical protein
MPTLSPKHDTPQPMSHPFFTSRLGPCIAGKTEEQHRMSIVFLQGGGLSRQQLDEVPLWGLRLRFVLRRWFLSAHPEGHRRPAEQADQAKPEFQRLAGGAK